MFNFADRLVNTVDSVAVVGAAAVVLGSMRSHHLSGSEGINKLHDYGEATEHSCQFRGGTMLPATNQPTADIWDQHLSYQYSSSKNRDPIFLVQPVQALQPSAAATTPSSPCCQCCAGELWHVIVHCTCLQKAARHHYWLAGCCRSLCSLAAAAPAAAVAHTDAPDAAKAEAEAR